MSKEIFKEEAEKFILFVHKTKFTAKRSAQKDLRIQEMLAAEDPEKLEEAILSEEPLELTIRYKILPESARD